MFQESVDSCKGSNPDNVVFVQSKYPALLTPGYLNAEEASSKLYKFNMLSTGDIGRFLPNGSLQFLGRNSDSIRHKGQNISAWEVESGLSLCSLVVECAVVGVQAKIGEQDIYCFVIPNLKENFAIGKLIFSLKILPLNGNHLKVSRSCEDPF